MEVNIRSVEGDSSANELRDMAELAAGEQGDHETFVMYLGATAASIADEIGEVEDWAERSAVVEIDGRMAGWLVADVDREMGRVWWLGPFIAQSDPDLWADIADRLYRRVLDLLPDGVTEQESAADDRGGRLTDWCVRNGFSPNTASVLLHLEPNDLVIPDQVHRIRPLADADHGAVKELHQLAFPGTHTTPEALVSSSDHPRLVLEIQPGQHHDDTDDPNGSPDGNAAGNTAINTAGYVAGYVAYELQPDGSGYVDYLAVDQTRRGSGYGGALVAEASRSMIAQGVTHVHLTVREDNTAARALYARTGFTEERLVRPYRIGFDLG